MSLIPKRQFRDRSETNKEKEETGWMGGDSVG